MGKRVADQHAVVERWREIADELAKWTSRMVGHLESTHDCRPVHDALRRYEEARNG